MVFNISEEKVSNMTVIHVDTSYLKMSTVSLKNQRH